MGCIFTKGQGEPLYVKFFNCNYYSQNDALKSISNGADIAVVEVVDVAAEGE